MPRSTVQSAMAGAVPSVDHADAICRALGITLTLGAGDDRATNDRRQRSTRSVPESDPATEPVRDRALAEMLAALADEYEEMNDAGRRSLAVRFWAAHPDLRERERTLARVVAWLGWRVVDGGAFAPAVGRRGD